MVEALLDQPERYRQIESSFSTGSSGITRDKVPSPVKSLWVRSHLWPGVKVARQLLTLMQEADEIWLATPGMGVTQVILNG